MEGKAKESTEHRSWTMSRVKSKDTAPEMIVRRLVYRLGYRYRLHVQKLPGKPDLVFASRRQVLFVNGCFWHSHSDPACKRSRIPSSRQDYWIPKLERNKRRDEESVASLRQSGWSVMVVWECDLKNLSKLEADLIEFLGERG